MSSVSKFFITLALTISVSQAFSTSFNLFSKNPMFLSNDPSTQATLEAERTPTCPAGYYCPSSDGTQNTCPPGYYCPENSVRPTPCPAGTYNLYSGQADLSSCLICTLDNYCPAGCSRPVPCPIGTSNNLTGSVSSSNCTYCPTGNNNNKNDTVQCPTGAYPIYAGNCDQCPAGTYLSTTGDASLPICIICPEGYYCENSSSSPVPCPSGTYNRYTGGTDELYCFICPAGFYCPDEGTYSPSGCPIGTYSSVEGLVSEKQCTPCDAGYYCNYYGMPYGISCPIGFYCPSGSIYPIPCPDGTFGLTTGFSSVEQCRDCPISKENIQDMVAYRMDPNPVICINGSCVRYLKLVVDQCCMKNNENQDD